MKDLKRGDVIRFLGAGYFIVGILVVGLFFLIIFGIGYLNNFNGVYNKVGTDEVAIASAVVTNSAFPPDSAIKNGNYINSEGYTTTFSYKDENGKSFESTVKFYDDDLKKGDVLDVYYDKTAKENVLPVPFVNTLLTAQKALKIIAIVSIPFVTLPGIIAFIIGIKITKSDKKNNNDTNLKL